MRVAIMQPYFMPYVGYFQLINSVDKFVVYDNIKYTKKGWINRNRMLVNNKDSMFSIPLKKDSDYLNISERVISENFTKDKFLSKIYNAYLKAPSFKIVFPVVEDIVNFNEENLFSYIYHSLVTISKYLEIDTEFIISSSLKIDDAHKGEEKVLSICKEIACTEYINPIGGTELYSKNKFKENGINLSFLKSSNVEYTQFNSEFIPWLSILDIMMFNPVEEIKRILNEEYTLE